MNKDELVTAMLSKIPEIQEIAQIAWAFSEMANTPGERREYDRIGIRANDLLSELAIFICRNT